MFSNSFVIQILDYLDLNLYKKITIDELSNVFHYHRDYIMRVFKKEIKMTIIEYINHKKIYLSLNSFKEQNTSILGIALNYGFFSQEYYSEIFHRIMGVSPTCYQLFLRRSPLLSNDDIVKIQENITFLSSLFQRIDAYRKNIPPKDTRKVLTIFK